MSARLEVFDPPMCCPTGVCGPSVDPELVRFAADLRWIEEHGVTVERHNLAQEPKAFVENPVVLAALNAEGASCLPIVLVDGQQVTTLTGYPPRQHLLDLLGLRDGE
jgi:hypothetical protein